MIVTLPGLLVSGAYLAPMNDILHGFGFSVLAPDLPGSGESWRPKRVLDVGELAESLRQWMEAVALPSAASPPMRSLPPVTLFGTSSGCQIATALARSHPERVARLVLAGPTVNAHARSAFWQACAIVLNGLIERNRDLKRIIREDRRGVGPRGLLRAARPFLRRPIEADAALVTAPALIVRGDRDFVAPKRWARELAARFPHGSLRVIPGGGHTVHFTHPRQTAEAIRDFIRAREAAP